MIQATPPASQSNQNSLEEWKPYELDHLAQLLVIDNRDRKDVLNESHKMRMTISYGLERFWGEQFRLKRENEDKAKYWENVWKTFLDKLLKPAGIGLTLPSKSPQSTPEIKEMADAIWNMEQDEREIALMILTQFCDSLVWWTQRYKKKKE